MPLIIRLAARCMIFALLFLLIGVVGAAARHYLGPLHLGIASRESIFMHQGGFNMLLVLWFFGLLPWPARTKGGAA
ncbi:MAG: hypothetical protein EON59_03995 [Alphaproteobacteria bacterium]|nr:MAG: hypothetical protein EON59_03995 [Alphaproteobacteria bacterium]